jgi:hypothetical protein
MQGSRGRNIGNQASGSRVRRARITEVSVWALIGMALLVWGKPSEGQVAGRQEIRSVPGQVFHQPRQSQVLTPLIRSGSLMPSTVTMDGGKLSVSLREARIHDVMEAIARQSGIQIIFVGQAAQATLTESFSGLPLEDGLRRLLRGKNYMLMYSGTERESRIAKVFVMSRTGAPVEDFGEQTPSIAEVISEAFDTQRFAETVRAAIIAAGGMTQEDQAPEGKVAPELNTNFQRLLWEGGGAKLLDDQFQRVADQLQRLLQQRRQ